ncbi:hypothetical protein [Dyella sp.]|uniref:hypothetical protein n=1 Tax=Dyella sp. TaxID=1869338 RepID=UPI002B4A1651|nr:hypothetical protein [Dyella sp.]HKT29803.1 hypothetical protein [Dyella sp.]
MIDVLNAGLDAGSARTVIPAKAGIQFKYIVRSTPYFFISSAAHTIVALDSGLRRNDIRQGNSLTQVPGASASARKSR